jgi:hypothetical protein
MRLFVLREDVNMATKSVMKIVTVRSEGVARRLLDAFENGEKREVKRVSPRGPVVDVGREEVGRLLGGVWQ